MKKFHHHIIYVSLLLLALNSTTLLANQYDAGEIRQLVAFLQQQSGEAGKTNAQAIGLTGSITVSNAVDWMKQQNNIFFTTRAVNNINYIQTISLENSRYRVRFGGSFQIKDFKYLTRLSLSAMDAEIKVRDCPFLNDFRLMSNNVEENFTRDKIDSQLKSEIITVLGPCLGKLGKGLEYHEISFQTEELARLLNEALTAKWRDGRGIEIVNFGITCVATPEDEARIKQMQTTAVMRDPTMAAASLVAAQGDAMRTAAGNTSGAMTGFMGMGMASQAGGMNPQALFQMGAQNQQQVPASGTAAGWACACGHSGNTGKFCAECGKPNPAAGWTCACGHAGNTGKFCAECGKSKE